VFELDDLVGAILTERFDRGGVAEVVRPLHRVVGVILPGVGVPEGGVDPAFGRARVASHRVEFRDDSDIRTGLVGGDGGPESGSARADDDDIVFVHGWCVGF